MINRTDDSVIKALDQSQENKEQSQNKSNAQPNKSLVDFIEGDARQLRQSKDAKSVSVSSQKSEGKTLMALRKCIKK